MHKDQMWIDPEARTIVTISTDALKRQAETALDEIRAANGGQDPPSLRAAYDVAPAAFARLIEALFNLGADVSDDLVALAGLRPINEVIGP